MAEDPEGFAARWSRRKRVAKAEAAAPKPDPVAEAAEAAARADAEAARLEEEEANRLAAEAVDLEALSYGDDFSVFLKRGVPDLLRRRALRKFFGSDPLLANLDGLNDYDDDYNNPAHRVYRSAWDAAKGYAEKAGELAEKAGDVAAKAEDAPKGRAAAGAAAPADPEAPEAGAEGAPARAETAHDVPGQDGVAQDEAPHDDPGQQAPEAPRRVSLRRRLEV